MDLRAYSNNWGEKLLFAARSVKSIVQGLAQIMPLLYYKIISIQFCNITRSHSNIPCDVLGEMFRLKP